MVKEIGKFRAKSGFLHGSFYLAESTHAEVQNWIKLKKKKCTFLPFEIPLFT